MRVMIVAGLLALALVGCAAPRSDGFDWGDKRVLDCIGSGKC